MVPSRRVHGSLLIVSLAALAVACSSGGGAPAPDASSGSDVPRLDAESGGDAGGERDATAPPDTPPDRDTAPAEVGPDAAAGKPVGAACADDAECASGTCLLTAEGETLPPGFSLPFGLCTRLGCDDDADCGDAVCALLGDPAGDHTTLCLAVCGGPGECRGGYVCHAPDGGAAACVPGDAVDCDDDDPCTADSFEEGTDTCAHAPVTGACDDGDDCTADDVCLDGACAGTPVTCDDGVACTVDACGTPGGCTHAPDDGACDEGNPCAVRAYCDVATGCAVEPRADGTPCTVGGFSGECRGGLCAPPVDCETAADCDDGVACTVDACDPESGACTNALDDAACDDGVFCNGAETCAPGVGCRAGAAPDCGDGLDCTEDACDGATDACVHNGLDAACSDGEACTTDVCDPGVGCQHAPRAGACDDDDACTTGDTCVAGACVGGAPLDCDDADTCTVDGCDTQHGCGHTAVDDGTGCVVGAAAGACVAGVCEVPCVAGACDDGVPCTVDTCVAATGHCRFEPDATACDDGDPCDGAETCHPTLGCRPGAPLDCDDGVACTIDECGAAGCTHEAADALCDDDEGCTVDTCVAGAGCRHVPAEGTACDDGDPCTAPDACGPFGTCDGPPRDCGAPSGPCVERVCDAAIGACVESPLAAGAGCDDGDACTAGDVCDGQGACVGPEVVQCPAPGTCHEVACDPAAGCIVSAAADGTGCDDGVACTNADRCAGGVCGGTPQDGACLDVDPCTDDACEPGVGCRHVVAPGNACDDGDRCTTDDVCGGAGACAGTPVDCTPFATSCRTAACDGDTGACATANVGDGTGCPGGTCQTGVCVSVCDSDDDCADGVACTADACVASECRHTPQDAACDDHLFCNGPELCHPTAGCVHGARPDCDDETDCTADSCSDALGTCVNAANDGACDDSNGCTSDVCVNGQGCLYGLLSDVGCDDGLECTTGDTCHAGVCSGVTRGCDDGIACTTDGCTEGAGCTHTSVHARCDDGNPCTSEVCSVTTGCSNPPVADDSPCATTGFCRSGVCTTGCLDVSDCDDGLACTTDACVASVCQYVPNDAACGDGDPCTVDACVPPTGCTHQPLVACCGDGVLDPGEGCDDGNAIPWDGCTGCAVGMFRVNVTTAGDQATGAGPTRMAVLPNQRLVTTWDSSGQDGSGWGVYGRVWGKDGLPVTGELRLNTFTTNDQTGPAVAAFWDNRFQVAWSSYRQYSSSSDWDLVRRIFDADGTPATAEIDMWLGAGNQSRAALASWPATQWHIAFHNSFNTYELNDDHSGLHIERYVYNTDGSLSWHDTEVNTTTPGDQAWPDVVAFSDETAFVVWEDAGNDGSGLGVFGRREFIQADTSIAWGAQSRVNTYTAGDQGRPQVAGIGSGWAVVVWHSAAQDGSGYGVYAQRYDPQGNARGGELRVNQTTTNDQYYPDVAMFRDGRFIVVWAGVEVMGTNRDVYARIFGADGVPEGDEWRVNDVVAGMQSSPNIVTFDDGGYLIAWQTNEAGAVGYDVVAERYNASNQVCYGPSCADHCEVVPDVGCCHGTALNWCEGGETYALDCAGSDAVCGWRDDLGHFDCGGSDAPPAGTTARCPWDCRPTIGCEALGIACGPHPQCSGVSCGGCGDTHVCVDAACVEATGPGCEAPVVLGCGATMQGSTVLTYADIDDYTCVGFPETGGEYAYVFSTPTSRSVTLTLTAAVDLDVFVLATACDPDLCLFSGATEGGAETVTFTATANTVYYVIVDGYAGARGPFTLTATCN